MMKTMLIFYLFVHDYNNLTTLGFHTSKMTKEY